MKARRLRARVCHALVATSLSMASAASAQESPPDPAQGPPLIVVLPPAPLPPSVTPVAEAQGAPRPPVVDAPPAGPAVLNPTPPPPERLSTRLGWRVEGGATFSRLYDIGITGGEGTIAVGAEFPKSMAVYVGFTLFGGVQETGLSAFTFRVTTDVEGRFGRFRLGIGAALGEVVLARATSGQDNEAPTVGVLGLTSFDIVQWGRRDESALYVDVKIRADLIVSLDSAPLLWGPSIGAGVRF